MHNQQERVVSQKETVELLVRLEGHKNEYWIIRDIAQNDHGGHKVHHLGGKAYVHRLWKRFR